MIQWIKDWVETIRIMKNKDLMESIRRAQKDVEAGRILTRKEFEKDFPDYV